jgi:hypothetical protein
VRQHACCSLAASGLVVVRSHKVFAFRDLDANAGAGIEIGLAARLRGMAR